MSNWEGFTLYGWPRLPHMFRCGYQLAPYFDEVKAEREALERLKGKK